ncbi:RGCVC family protein [Pseudonocardia sp. GCM10023141]|uniref:RGCVC family protein n=1 Tax=Pseudonocardia sp. GCM10023141 TaxID=3252653 RepID=UPI00361FC0A1
MSALDAPPAIPVPAIDMAALTCASCPHLRAAHDRIGLRYCSATTAGALERGCVCAPGTSTADPAPAATATQA